MIELLVAIVIFAILFLIIDAVFISAHRGARKAEVGADVNQNARVAVDRLISEIRESSVSVIQPDPPGYARVVFRSARPSVITPGNPSNQFCLDWGSNADLAAANPDCTGISPTGTGDYTPVWQQWIGYYFVAGELRRVVSTVAITPADLPGIPLYQVVATSVENFTACPPGGGSLGDPVCPPEATPTTLTVTLQGKGQEKVQGSDVPPQEIVLRTKTVIRN